MALLLHARGHRLRLSLRRLTHLVAGVLDGLDDVDVARAAAEVARDRMPNLGLARVGILLQQRGRRHHHARCAEATLQPVLLEEALLHGAQLTVALQPLNGAYPAALHL